MKSTGIVRHIDELGRIVLPMELRNTLDIGRRDRLEIFVDGDKIVLRKYRQTCVFCGSEECLTDFRDKLICAECIKAVSK